MPQETDFNISPYFDDFDPYKNYHRVLFKPGYPVQARELNTVQSILQNQIEQFGSNTFKEGAAVSGGEISYKNDLNAVLIENQFLGIDVSSYFTNITKKIIRGRTSGVTATVEYCFDSNSSSNTFTQSTLYVTYLTSDTGTNSIAKFLDGEELEITEDSTATQVVNNRVTRISLQSGQSFAKTISSNCTRVGSAVILKPGVWFLRGNFVNVIGQTLFLDPYGNTPSYRVGFIIKETFVNSYEDSSLNDNSNGFSNYAAPGADRFRIEAQLAKVPLSSTDTENFIQLKEIRTGIDYTFTTTSFNAPAQEMARRTYDESGDYYVKAPSISAKETLNDLKGNNGVFYENQLTYNNNIPSENLGTYSISPTNAYVRGFNVGNVATTFLDFQKPRTTKNLNNQSINYYTGPTYTLNRVDGSPVIGLSTTYTVSLRSSRKGDSRLSPQGKEIGLARVYDFALESGSYSFSNRDINQWDITLYDLQTYTDIAINEPISLTAPTHIKGKSSGATGYLRYSTTNSGILTAYNIKGIFSIGEKLIFNGIENPRVSVAVTSYSESDVQSIYGIVGTGFTFTADTKLYSSKTVGSVNISASSNGISTVTSNDTIFTGIATVGNIVSFTNPGFAPITYAKVVSVAERSLIISGITTVSGICEGSLPNSSINPGNFSILSSRLQSSRDNTLYTVLPKKKIASVDLTSSYLTIRKQYNVTISSYSVGPITSLEDETFLPFDEERYVLVREDGYTEELTSDKFVFTDGARTLSITGLNSNGPAKLIATLRKINVKEKIKNRNKVKTLIVSNSKYQGSGVGATTLNDGLVYGTYPYGTRVQDEEICLLEPDVTKIYGVFESNDTNNAELPSLTFSSISGPTNKTSDLILGEEVFGETSKSIAVYSEKINDLKIGFVYLNANKFAEGERVTFKESGITAIITSVDSGDINVTSNYVFESGQKDTIYDYSRVIRKANTKEPTKRLKIVYESASFSSSDNGDLITANSYNQFDYCDLGSINGISNSDILDIRPRVSNASISAGSLSPFEFLSRNFTQSGNNTSNVLASDESILLNYSFYLPRVDKIFLTKNGIFQLTPGVPSENPKPPTQVDDALELATIVLPPYLCDMKEVAIYLTEHKRYRMSDIKKLEDRIKNLEYYTALSLLETNTSNLYIPDTSVGGLNLNRFKCGFFVDDFSTTLSQKKVTEVKNSIDIPNSELRPSPFTTQIDLLLGTQSLIGIGTIANSLADARYTSDLIGSGIRRTGQLLTLDYEEVPEIIQPYSTLTVNINPYADSYYAGTIQLFPSSDVWVDQVKLDPKTITAQGNYTETLSQQQIDPQTGFGPVTWNSWETVWTGSTTNTTTRQISEGYNIYQQTIETTTQTGTSTRSGTASVVKEQLDSTSLGDVTISTSVIPYMRSRNVEFTAKRLRPLTRVYSFFDGVDVNSYIAPKLLEIEIISGVFQVGETVFGNTSASGLGLGNFRFRVAKQNHKYGPYDAPTDIYTTNPYNPNSNVAEIYSSTSTILNVDTYSLSNMSQSDFYGYPIPGMILRGQTSGAEARITDIRLITDNVGTVIGSYQIPDPNLTSNPAFEVGSKVFRLTSSSTNSQIEGVSTTGAEETYFAEGTVNTTQENIIVIRNARVESQAQTESRAETSTGPEVVVSSTLIGNNAPSYSYNYSPSPSPSSGGRGYGASGNLVEISGAVQTGDYGQFSGKTINGISFNTDGSVVNGTYIGNGQFVYSPGSTSAWGTIDPATGKWKDTGVPNTVYTNTSNQQVYGGTYYGGYSSGGGYGGGSSPAPASPRGFVPGVGYFSDQRLKKNIRSINNSLDIIMKIEVK